MDKLYTVGGCVRDELLGLKSKDIDFTYVCSENDKTIEDGWEEMRTFLKDNKYKIFLETPSCFTIRAKFPEGHIHEGLVADFVMARKEVGYKPGTRLPILELGTIQDDLARRDFTCNAIAKNLKGEIIDPFNGVKAIQDKVLLTPLPAFKTFDDDPLRILRALRFSITKGFRIGDSVWAAMFLPGRLEKLRSVVSLDRIREEVTKMMKHDTIETIHLFKRIDAVEPEFLETIFRDGMWLQPSMKKK